MIISILNDHITHTIDYSKKDSVEDGFIQDYHPSAKECIEDFLWILGNEYSREQISDALADGLNAMENSEKGWAAKRKLEQDCRPDGDGC